MRAAVQAGTRVRLSLGAKSRGRRRPKAGAGGHSPPRAFAPAPTHLRTRAFLSVAARPFFSTSLLHPSDNTHSAFQTGEDRKIVVLVKSVSGRVEIGGRRHSK